jgi:hypothetical protein
MSMTLFYRANQREETVLATAGSFSAISALFGGPLVGGLLMVEGGLAMGTALLPVILPGFVASAVGYLIFVGLGDWGGLEAQGLGPNLPYDGTHLAPARRNRGRILARSWSSPPAASPVPHTARAPGG